MKKLTFEELKELKPCSTDWVERNRQKLESFDTLEKQVNFAKNKNRCFNDVAWLLTRLMRRKEERVEFAVYCAELVLPIFEKKYPDDKRPRKAIESAEDWLKNPCDDTMYAAGKEVADAVADAADWAADYAADGLTCGKMIKKAFKMLKTK